MSLVYRGVGAKELFLQAYQVILWKQCHGLIHTIGLPSELEILVKDLWALRLQLLIDKTTASSDEETLFSSQPTSGIEDSDEETAAYVPKSKAMPTLIQSLSLCYLATILLRLPVSIGDFHQWAFREEIIFIRAIRHVPTPVKERLPPELMLALDTTTALEPDDLRKAIHELIIYYNHHFGIIFPPLNAPLLLFRHMKDLSLPSSVFHTVTRLAAILSIDFRFPRPRPRQRLIMLPELTLMCLLIVAVKLYYPFDNLKRSVWSTQDPAILNLDWSRWKRAREKERDRRESHGHLPRGAEILVTEQDAMHMPHDQLDDYMDWFERTWVDEERARTKKRGVNEQILDWFPTGRLDDSEPTIYDHKKQAADNHESAETVIKDVLSGLEMRKIRTGQQEADGEAHERGIGSNYKRYKNVTELNTQALAFYEAAAEAVAVQLDTLVIGVLQIETSLLDWRTRQRRRNRKHKKIAALTD